MDALDKLLAIPNSELARVLQLSLQGLRATLQAALQTFPEDAGTEICQELIQALDHQLTSPSAWESILEPAQSSPSLILAPLAERKLEALYETVQGNSELEPYLGKIHLQNTDDAALWNEIQRLLLRVPTAIAQHWQARIQHLTQSVGAINDVSSTQLKPLPWIATLAADVNSQGTAVVYPGLTGSVQATGLCLSKQATLDHQLNAEVLQEDLAILAKVVTICLKFVEQPDQTLHHALQTIDSFELKSLTSPQERRKYVNALLDRFKRVQIAEKSQDITEILLARLDLDEAIHSLVYFPPVDRDTSWWGKLQQSARRTLMTKARQHNIQVRALWGSYAEVRQWSKNDLEIDVGGIQGEVSACLRVYSKLNQEDLPGRVIFRSSR